MKKSYAFSLLAVLAIAGCKTDEPEVIHKEPIVFTATIEDGFGADTKTSLDAGGNVLWKQDDQVSIFAGSTVNEHYQVTDASDGKTAATLNRVEDPGAVAGTDIDNNVAYYPYASTASIEQSGASYIISNIELPATQNYAEASFGNGAFPMTAVSSTATETNLAFKNVLGGLKLQLKGTATIASIRISGKNNEILCGDAQVTLSYGSTPSINLTDASAKKVTLDCGTGVALDAETATPFIIALPPVTMAGGFTVLVTDTEGKQMEITTSKSQTITRSSLLKMPAVNYVGKLPDYVDLGLSVKWAKYNLCESGFCANPEDYGDYYAWGETETKSNYSWSTYKWCNGTNTTLTKYNSSSSYGTVDGKTTLDPEDDVAYVILGGSWRMPTKSEWSEITDFTNFTWVWTTENSVKGWLITSKINGNSIFLPAAGVRSDNTFSYVNTRCQYWSSSLYSNSRAWFWWANVNNAIPDKNDRCLGQSIRPVYTD